jgi:Insulin-induced protein (INSIG)
MSNSPRILRPTPRRPFELPSADSSQPSTPSGEPQGNDGIEIDFLDAKNDLAAKRSGSLLNLTSSTLLGIFQPTAFEDTRQDDSPWDTQLHTPIEQRSDPLVSQLRQELARSANGNAAPSATTTATRKQIHRTGSAFYAPLVLKISLLFACGVAYGTIIAHLHENNWITPVKLEYIDNSYRYLVGWGIAGVGFAFVLPWLDNIWGGGAASVSKSIVEEKQNDSSRVSRWTLAVRSIGAFVGIGFAMVRALFFFIFQLYSHDC